MLIDPCNAVYEDGVDLIFNSLPCEEYESMAVADYVKALLYI